jgi:hypothetical protein
MDKPYFAVLKVDPLHGVVDFIDGDLVTGWEHAPFIFAAALREDWNGIDAIMDGYLYENFDLVEAPVDVYRQQLLAENSVH